MDGKVHLDSAQLEGLGQFRGGVLALRHGQAVAGNNDHALRVTQQHGDVLGAGGAHRALTDGGGARRRTSPERPEQDARHTAAHGGSHGPGQDGAGRSHQRAGNKQQHVAQHQARGRDGQAGEGVQQ
ncbi:hypothetical protein D9M72_531870 [compost metagenome]